MRKAQQERRSFQELVKLLRYDQTNLREKFQVEEIALFGSYVRNEQQSKSDLDILVEFKPGKKTFDRYMDLKFYLEELLNLKVDLIIKASLRQEIKSSVLVEAVYV